ncbi:MAG TPA: periplasmic heavy metal sensor [Nannocystaceae bacterium]|nr:periplasmic heavy metal sensor [Nannocystaceae bacterium]
MLRRHMAFITTTLLSLGLLGAVADAPAPTKGEHPGFAGKLCEKLTCTASQKTQVQSITKELKEDTKPDREAIQQTQRKLAVELAKASPSEKVVDTLAAEMAKHQAEMTKRGLEAVLEVHALLDASQRTRFAEIIADHGVRGLIGHGGHKGGGRRGKPGAAKASKAK